MRFPLAMTASIARYVFKNKLHPRAEWQKSVAPPPQVDLANPFRVLTPKAGGQRKPHPMIGKRFPIVLMLEPLHACNLTCTGCGRIREYKDSMQERVPLEECLAAVDECGAPVVSICGGEPLIYPQIGPLVRGVLERGRNVYLCTNGVFLRKRLGEFTPNKQFYFNVHLDGLEKSHDAAVEREGVFRAAVEGIKAAKAAGFQVCTNTTIYKETQISEIARLFAFLTELGVDGFQIAPGYGYSAVDDREMFLTREDIHAKFREFERLASRFAVHQTPMYMEFLRGERELPCTAWGNPTYNVKGWKGPCYLITDGHYKTFEELMQRTPWESYGPGNDPRCKNCMMHCGFEPSVALGIGATLGDNLKMLGWMLQ
jgi:hopanoid biosynthesis associated radical SAM protein HpnH